MYIFHLPGVLYAVYAVSVELITEYAWPRDEV